MEERLEVALVQVKRKAQITLPVRVRRELGIEEGDYLEARVEGNRVVLIPQTVIAKLPTVTLSEQGERVLDEALDDVRDGRVVEHPDVQSLLDELHREAEED